MDAYDYCRYLTVKIGKRWTGSPGEKRAGDWVEKQLARMGYETRQVRIECPAWECEGEELFLGEEEIQAGAQLFSGPCELRGELAVIVPKSGGGFTGEAAGKIALVREDEARGIEERNRLLAELESAGALAAIIVSSLAETYSTKLFRNPECGLPAVAVSRHDGEKLYGGLDRRVRLRIRTRRSPGTTSNVIGEKGPGDGHLIMVSAHHESAPDSPGALDNASGVGVVLAVAEAFSRTRVGARLRFCTFGGHESGMIGSKMYVRNHGEELKQFKRMLNVDGVGVKGRRQEVAVFGPESTVEGMRRIAARLGDLAVAQEKGEAMGDSLAFAKAGLESVWLRAQGAATDFPIHSPDDDMRWVDRETMKRCVEIGVAIIEDWMKER